MGNLSQQKIDELRETCKKSLWFFSRVVLGWDALTTHLHKDIAELVQDIDKYPKLLLLLPRKHFKSTIDTISFPLWLIIQDWIPRLGLKGCDVRILIANESAANAQHFLNVIETICDNNELFRALFGHLIPEINKRNRWNTQEMLVNRTAQWPEATIETIGVGGAAQSRHYDVLILDDLIGKEAMDSETVMEKVQDWYDYSESLSISPQRSIFRVIGTRWSRRDLYQHIIDKEKEFHVYTRQCIEDNKPIFPEWYTTEYFDTLRQKNLSHYMSQYCNDPTDPGKCDFKEEWIKTYTWERKDDSLQIKFEDDPKPVDYREFDITGAFDPSIGDKPSASRRAIGYVGMDSKQRVCVFDTYVSRDTTDKVLDQLFKMYRKWSPRVFGVESVALSSVYIPLIEKESQLRNQSIRVIPIKVSSRKSKETRIRDAIQQVAAEGRLYRQVSMRDFDEEFIEFPQGLTNDLLDAIAHAINLLRPGESTEDTAEYDRLEEQLLGQRNKVTGY